MNFPQCQERLDERLDGLRSGLQSGALSPLVAREQAQLALDEAARECGDSEAELRAHTQMRLALMIPVAGEVQAVPPALRVNVRRALEREAVQRPIRSSWRPIMNFAWTGGAMLSALGLFLVARPFLMERAQTPVTESAAPQLPSDAAPNTAPILKPKIGVPTPKAPLLGSSSAAKPAPKSGEPKVAPAPPLETQSAPAPAQSAPAPLNQKPLPRFEVRAPSPLPKTDEAGAFSRSPAPPAPHAPEQIPPVGSGSPPLKQMKRGFSRPSLPIPSPTDTAFVAVSGAELGLTARFVPAPQNRTRTRAGVNADLVQPPMVGSAPPSLAPRQKTAPSQPTDSVGASPSQAAPGTASELHPDHEASPSRPLTDGARGSLRSPSLNERFAGPLLPAPSPGEVGTISVSVERTVVNVRVVGRVQSRNDEGIELWSGNAIAHQLIPVSLAALHAASGDTVQVSMEQKLDAGKTKALATTSVLVP